MSVEEVLSKGHMAAQRPVGLTNTPTLESILLGFPHLINRANA